MNSSIHILLTGGAGYIGSHMLLELLDAGYSVTVVDDFSTGLRERIPSSVPFFPISTGDEKKLDELFCQKKIDLVMHFAASIKVDESVRAPSKYYQNNFTNTLILLDVMNRHAVRNIIFSSTAAIFGEPEYLPVDEGHVKNPINPYGSSKLMCEQALHDYDIAHGIKSVSLRYFNAAGADPRQRTGFNADDASHLIPVALRAAMSDKKEMKIFGTDYDTQDGTCVRDYIHVLDLCEAHLLAMQYLLKGGSTACFNLGNGKGYTVKQVLDAVEATTGKKLRQIVAQRRAGDPAMLVADSTLAHEILDWTPKHSDLTSIVEHAWLWMDAASKIIL